ncbi:AzlC family ABC transporter permease [Consotaella salsifontis]|uniref:Predicted branched-chain amino acid permease (Azaleucine resistance) n=1 Tax=Consotaella salsifontis TaxID=1365950 RepID=A0A1T4M9G0_9HYPH|nr:AzlC family ABC transporter permease [Consotaella salsifontis]SJZ63476.1 Predicted branched-chain amino acid permease (azaleucine resistance) [Consotaella salsifontis]
MSRQSEFREALRDALPVAIASAPFGMVCGAIAVGAGMTIVQATSYSATVNAGASQLVALQVTSIGGSLASALLALLAVNARMVLYSVIIGRHFGALSLVQKAVAFFLLTDPMFVTVEVRAMTRKVTPTYIFTFGIALYTSWVVCTAIGAKFGQLIEDPRAFALDFILPVFFFAMLMGFRRRPGFYAVAGISAAASIAVYLTLGPPWHITLGAAAGLVHAAITAPSAAARSVMEARDE